MSEPAKRSGYTPSRREFAAFGGIAALSTSGAAPLAAATQSAKAPLLSVKNEGNLFRPEIGEHPGLVMFASAAASRSANSAVAHQLASQGWAVLLVDAPTHADSLRINREAQNHVAYLNAQTGVATASPVPSASGISKQGYVLQSFTAAQPALSLASREARIAANCSGILFALPAAALSKSHARRDSLHIAARSLHRMAA